MPHAWHADFVLKLCWRKGWRGASTLLKQAINAQRFGIPEPVQPPTQEPNAPPEAEAEDFAVRAAQPDLEHAEAGHAAAIADSSELDVDMKTDAAEGDAQNSAQEDVSSARHSYNAAVAAISEVQEKSTMSLEQKTRKPPGEDVENDDDTNVKNSDPAVAVIAAVEAYDIAVRSHRFFDRTLAATRGEASVEQRACSICLDDDIPREKLSITMCAHVFCSDCIADVVAKFGNCPQCRQRLDLKKDVASLSAELAAVDANALSSKCNRAMKAAVVSRGEAKSNAQLRSQFGSKLAVMAERLLEIGSKGEKAIVFCQWEDLKCKLADALGAFGVDHFQLRGNVYQRGEVLRKFQEDQGPNATPVLLLSLEHSASGTNLTAANHVVFVHPMNTSSAERAVAYEAQAIGRCRRFGQERSEVHCWRFVVCGTIEETITTRHRQDLWDNHLARSVATPPTMGGC